jgi:hypothetical protein
MAPFSDSVSHIISLPLSRTHIPFQLPHFTFFQLDYPTVMAPLHSRSSSQFGLRSLLALLVLAAIQLTYVLTISRFTLIIFFRIRIIDENERLTLTM